MDDDYWNPARLPIPPMSSRPTPAELKERKEDTAASERIAIRYALDRTDPDAARRLLKRLARQLSDGIKLSAYAREYLSYAIDQIADNPSRAASCLGLTVRRGKPRVDNHKLMLAMHLVAQLNANGKGVSLKGSREKNGGAFLQAAIATGISESIIAREWPKWKHCFVRPVHK